MTTNHSDKAPDPVDIHVGARIRVRRRSLSVTQEVLANDLGLTFQQIQKYERGSNRVSASKLYEIARSLRTPVPYFFEGLDNAPAASAWDAAPDNSVHEFLMTDEGLELAAAFPTVKAPRLRRQILELVRTMAEDDAGSETD